MWMNLLMLVQVIDSRFSTSLLAAEQEKYTHRAAGQSLISLSKCSSFTSFIV